ncbi:MAG: hypothetical protein P4L53_11860 [Candidatus Obscuribacterales bacterium]|nr:hypothetical protein [Candidatus Obscuribacterales bacterium]
MRHARNLANTFALSKRSTVLAVACAVVALTSIGAAYAQSSSLPPTNMGKFVHQPGDNQYSNSTQAERHAPPPPPPRPTAMMMAPAQSVGYVPVPRVPKPDPTLSYIAADEPVVQAGFPPLPDRADLPGSGSGWNASAMRGGGGGGGGGNWGGPGGGSDGPGSPGGVDTRIEKKSYNGYRHAEAGAYAPQEPTRHYRSSNTASDSYAVNGGGGGGGAAPNPVASLGKEPSLNPRADAGIVAEAPAPVVVKQATTQDLSLPDDEFSGSSTQQKKQPSGSSRMLKQMGRQMFISPMMQMSSMGSGMASRAIHF